MAKKRKLLYMAVLTALLVLSILPVNGLAAAAETAGIRSAALSRTAALTEDGVATSCPYVDGGNLLNDSSFESPGTSPFTNPREVSDTWKTVSWAGTDKNGWGYQDNNNVYMIYSDSNLIAGEYPTVYQDVSVEKNSYYVVSLYAHTFGYTEQQPALTVGYRSPTANDSWLDLQKHAVEKVGADWEERYAVIYTQNYSSIRLMIQTESIWVDGTLGGYHVDNVRMFKVKTPEAVDFEIPSDFRIGEDIKPVIKVRFEGESAYRNVQPNSYIRTDYRTVEGDDIFTSDHQNTLAANAEGQASLKLSLNIFGRTLESSVKNITVGESNRNSGAYIKNVSVHTVKNITDREFADLDATVEMSDGSYVRESDYILTYASSNPRVVAVRQLNGTYCAIAVGNGSADIIATVKYGNSVCVGKYSVSVETENYLVDSGFEVQADYHFWASEGTSGSGMDDGTTNGYMHSGIANFWIMAPVWWDGTVQPTSDARISQVVDLKAGKYALSAYINRFNATGPDGMLSGQGGNVTIGAIKLDETLNETDVRFSQEFDTSYGTGGQYGNLSLVFDVEEEGKYLVYFYVEGDEQYGIGMQLDDMTLKKAKYPVRIVAAIEQDVIDVDDLNKIYVTAQYEDGSTEQITSNIRAIFEDYRVACESGGFVIGKAPGTTNVRVKTTILDKEYETTFQVTVKGSGKEAGKGLPTAAVVSIAVGSAALLGGAGAGAAVIIRKRKTKH